MHETVITAGAPFPRDPAARELLAETQRDLLVAAIEHVLRHGRVGKQSEARLRAALKAAR